MNDTISLWIATAIAAAFTFAIVFALLSIMPAHAAAAVDWRARRGAARMDHGFLRSTVVLGFLHKKRRDKEFDQAIQAVFARR
jgi:hypothetical protein